MGVFNQDLKLYVLAWRTGNICNKLFDEVMEA